MYIHVALRSHAESWGKEHVRVSSLMARAPRYTFPETHSDNRSLVTRDNTLRAANTRTLNLGFDARQSQGFRLPGGN